MVEVKRWREKRTWVFSSVAWAHRACKACRKHRLICISGLLPCLLSPRYPPERFHNLARGKDHPLERPRKPARLSAAASSGPSPVWEAQRIPLRPSPSALCTVVTEAISRGCSGAGVSVSLPGRTERLDAPRPQASRQESSDLKPIPEAGRSTIAAAPRYTCHGNRWR
ncbi:hypothetical protein SKAU_G00105040 [Synaphobranchus kaupii]|uniref:Uncharacterized protein n=1 Tax=Synaphobranchus kaupii TaxID=118154 RepID=A0A9Q1G0A6_SYNKA|nr:hypothetical protein SKAU_G00105040 [Synaphobranchus kaupii]